MVAQNKFNSSASKKKGSTNDSDDGFLKISLVNQAVFVRKRRTCPLENIPISEIDYKNLKLITKFLTERGKIIPARVTHVSRKKQKALGRAIKRARQIALLSPINAN
jgi:small subunit ribosomal protein S18